MYKYQMLWWNQKNKSQRKQTGLLEQFTPVITNFTNMWVLMHVSVEVSVYVSFQVSVYVSVYVNFRVSVYVSVYVSVDFSTDVSVEVSV